MAKLNRPRWEVIGDFILAHNLNWGAELGVFDGRCALALVQACPKLNLIAVDAFGLPIPRPKHRTAIDLCKCQHCRTTRSLNLGFRRGGVTGELLEERFRAKLKTAGAASRVHILRSLTPTAAATVTDRSLDFIFVDAGHAYEEVNADLVAWTPKVKKGGFVFGHDWNMRSVRGAVKDYFHFTHEMIRYTGEDHVWFVRRNK